MKFKHKLLIALAPLLLSACDKKMAGLLNSNTIVVNKNSIADLNSLMDAHPEFSSASLKEIKNAAQDSSNNDAALLTTLKLNTDAKVNESENMKPLDKEIAKKAQTLIDTILNEFDVEAQMNSDIKIIGIVMNRQRDFNENREKEGKASPQDNVEGTAPSAPDENIAIPIPSCEEIVAKPFGEVSEEKIRTIINTNKEQLKITISGCAQIQGKPFIQCMDNFNKMASLVNAHATCEMKDLTELTAIAEKEFGKTFHEIKNENTACLKNLFLKCGFHMKKN